MNYEPYLMHSSEDEKNAANRLLKKLRIALIVWLIIFVATVLWFVLS